MGRLVKLTSSFLIAAATSTSIAYSREINALPSDSVSQPSGGSLAEELPSRYIRFEESDRKLTLSFETTNDNILLGLGRKLGVGKDSSFEGDDRGKTAGIRIEANLRDDRGETSIAVGSNLYTSLATQNGSARSAGGAHYIKGAEDLFLNVARKHFIADNTFVRVEGQMGLVKDQGVVMAPLQDIWHKALDGKDYNYLKHRDNELYVSGKLGLGRTIAIYDSGAFNLTASYEGGVTAETYSGSYIDAYAATALRAGYKNMALGLHAEADSDRNFEIGVDLKVPVSGKVSLKFGSALLRDRLLDEYRNDDGSRVDVEHKIGLELSF